MRHLCSLAVLGLLMAGCGSAGSGSTANNVTMQAGQWEYVVKPDNGSITMYMDANVPGTNAEFSGTHALIFQPSQVGVAGSTSPIYCNNYNISGSISDSSLKGKLTEPPEGAPFADFSGDLASNGQSISSGKYSGGTCSILNEQVKGTLTGYTIAPVNGTFTGTLTSNLYGADVVTLSITQNPDFSLDVTGTSVANGVSTTLVGNNQNMSSSNVNGATVSIAGTSANVNGSAIFSVSAHANPAATQLTLATMQIGPNESLTGVLTKQ